MGAMGGGMASMNMGGGMASMNMGGGMGPMGMGGGMGPMGMGGGMMGMRSPMGDGAMGAMGGGKRGVEPRPGDWDCPRCYNLNFSSR